MTNVIEEDDRVSRPFALKKHKRRYALSEICSENIWDGKAYVSLKVQVGKYCYPLCALSQLELDDAEEKSHWAVGIPTSYAVRKADASLTLFPAPDQDGYMLEVLTVVVKND